jgi:hypothetical protein
VGPLKLSYLVVSQTDITRLRRELNSLNDFFTAAQARQTGTTMNLPKITGTLSQLAQDNGVNLLDDNQRAQLDKALEQVYEKAPSLHISFASEPSPRALQSVIHWLRTNIHPQALVQIGLQPSIAAGCTLRTPNHYFDLSLRTAIKKAEPYLFKLIAGAVDGR